MRLIRGTANAVLMMTLIKPVVRLTVARWRKRVQASPAVAMGLPVQELLETALLEELGATAVNPDSETQREELVELPAADRSTVRTLLIVGALVALSTGAAIATTKLVQRRRKAQEAKRRELVAVPVEALDEAVEEVSQESLIG